MDDETDNLHNMGYLQDIISYIFDEKKLVTYKWISNTLKIHVNRAKQLLYTFIKHLPAERLEELKVTYLVGGILPDNRGCRIQVVSEEDLTKVKENFKVITSEHIYSVSLKHCLSDLHDLYSVDGVKSNEISKHGALRCVQSQLKDPEKVAAKRTNVIVPTEADKKSVAPKQEENKNAVKTGEKRKANGISAMFSAASHKKKTEETIEPKKEDGNSKEENTSVVNKKAPPAKATSKGGKNAGGNRLAAMFSAQASKPKPVQNNAKTKEEKDTKETQGKEEVALTKEKVSPKSVSKDNKKATEKKSIDEKSPKGQNKKSQNSKSKQKKRKASEKDNDKNKKRKRIVVMDDSDSSEDDVFGSEEEDDVDQGRCPSPTMMDEDEDDECIKEETKEEEEPEQPTKRGRVRKRVEVDKTFLDEDGYIVCKKVVEFVSCSEDEDEKENEKGGDKKSKGDQKRNKSSSPKKSPPQKCPEKKKQATLMSFFKRN